ncbi:MAG: HU family DNA-binding protein [Clostridiales bacterium]|nr:HU family DNA-binding protein [Clostridiales bacterium]
MTKSELVTSVSAATGMPIEAALKAINAAFDEIINAVGKGDTVTIPGFGTFRCRLRKERTGRNPQTSEEITLPACKVPAFKSGRRMKEAVRNI